jgi:hypothetical protein
MLAPSQVASARPMLTSSFPYPINCHWLISISDTGRSIEIEDGSHWEVSPYDAYILSTWRREDSLVITPNYTWFGTYDYFITNKNNGTSVKADLYVGPIAFGQFSHWIINIDYLGGHILLENNMLWCVDPQDAHDLRNWALNDTVILGVNNSWFSSYDHILINVNNDDHVRVKQY